MSKFLQKTTKIAAFLAGVTGAASGVAVTQLPLEAAQSQQAFAETVAVAADLGKASLALAFAAGIAACAYRAQTQGQTAAIKLKSGK